MSTIFDASNQAFSDQAHLVAQKEIYPHLFPQIHNLKRHGWLSFESTTLALSERARILDGEMAVDRIVKVHGYMFTDPFCFSVQERFRRPQYLKEQDITITTWNHATDSPSELYKMHCGLFVYGYFDEPSQSMLQWIAINTVDLQIGLLSGDIRYKDGHVKRKDQDFIAVKFDELRRSGVVIGESGAYREAA